MKMILVLGLILFSNIVNAATVKPLITKSNYSGHTPQEWSESEVCELYSDRVVINHRMGTTLTLHQTINIATSGVPAAIDRAETEGVEKVPNGMCDGPSTVVRANKANGTEVKIFATGGCGNAGHRPAGPNGNHLFRLINRYCPDTNEIPSDGLR